MDASTRKDLVELFRPVEGGIPGGCTDRAVTMSGNSKRGVGTDDRQPDVQVLDYKSRTGADEQFKLFSYEYRESLATPRIPPILVGELTSGVRSWTLADIDEEYETGDYTFSAETPTKESSTQVKLPASSNVDFFYQGTGSQDCSQVPEGSDNILDGPHSADYFGHVYAASSLCGGFPRAKMDPLEENTQYPRVSHVPLDDDIGRRMIVGEKFQDRQWLSLLSMGGTSRDEPKQRPSENSPELDLLVDRHETQLRSPSEKSKSVASGIVHAEAASVDEEPLSSQHWYGQNKLPSHCNTPMLDDGGDGKVTEAAAEEITAALDRIDLESKISCSISALSIGTEPVSAESKSKYPKAADMDLQMMAHSVFGTGFWIEEDGNDLSNLDVEGLCEVYTTSNELGPPEDQLSDKLKSTFRNCNGDSGASGSSPKQASGGTSGRSGSCGIRQSASNGGSRHQKRLSEGGGVPEDEDDPDPSKKARIDKDWARRFVCPFYVNNPQYFRTSIEHGSKYMVCAAGIGFPDIARLKEHLRRVHSPEIICARCGSKFAEQIDLENHLRHEDGPECRILDLPLPKSMTPSMKEKLSKRGKHEKNLSEEEKWSNIYKLLFPNEPLPTTGIYRQDSDQPLTNSREKQILVHISERDLPQLLERRIDPQLGYILPDPESREQVKRMVISELIVCIKQISTDLPETPMSFDESNILRHKQSGESSTDSGYGSRCGNRDCMGNCSLCEQLGSPIPHPSQAYKQQPSSAGFDTMDQYLDPSVFTDPESTGHLQSTENMDELLDYNFPETFLGNPYLGGFGT